MLRPLDFLAALASSSFNTWMLSARLACMFDLYEPASYPAASYPEPVERGVKELLFQLSIYDSEDRQNRHRQKDAGDSCNLSAREDSEDHHHRLQFCAFAHQAGRQDIILENAEHGQEYENPKQMLKPAQSGNHQDGDRCHQGPYNRNKLKKKGDGRQQNSIRNAD